MPIDSPRLTAAKDVCELLPHMRSPSPRLARQRFREAIGALASSALVFGCSTTGPASSSAAPETAPTTARIAVMPGEKTQLRNNAASLLVQLLDQEKNVSKVLIIKHGSPELSELIKAISAATADGSNRLKGLAKEHPTIDLGRQELPAGEMAARAAEGKAEEFELLFSSGAKFEFALLLTQAQALNYGSHLAKVAADNSADHEEKDAFLAISQTLDHLLTQVKVMMQPAPSS